MGHLLLVSELLGNRSESFIGRHLGEFECFVVRCVLFIIILILLTSIILITKAIRMLTILWAARTDSFLIVHPLVIFPSISFWMCNFLRVLRL